MKTPPRSWTFGLLAALLTACSLKAAPDPNVQIQIAVNATLAALPTAAPAPTNPIPPAPTPFMLTGLFCEYNFCIGHPPDMAFYDVVAKQNPSSPVASMFTNGILAAHNNSLFIQLIWQHAPGATDPVFLIDLILEDGLDAPTGAYNLRLIRDMNVLSSPITTTASPLLPFGGVAGWVCGERAFAWKVYAPQAESFEALLAEALARFRCE
ncbi:MAG: hypothetical protein B6D40_01265 [Anaerolineae bacterium UTCFX3]|jgi:hypothetical protein|nr:MAG: hypothetical protein B6D40_01265 [Anaerolineae bacterium UTCFX3]